MTSRTSLPSFELIEELLGVSHGVPPHLVVTDLGQRAARFGLRDLDIYLVDYEQVHLIPLPRPGGPTTPLVIDATVAGRAYISGEMASTAADGGERLWLGLLDGAERLGVLGVTVDHGDDDTRRLCLALASLTAFLLVSKNDFTDLFELTRRTRVAGLASELQLQLLPPLTFVHPRVALAGVLEDAYETGGDAFDYAVNGGTAHFGIFDAMGHGMSASLLAATVVVGYRNCRRQLLGLPDTYAALDEVVSRQFQGDAFVTAQLGELEVETGEFTWINAGHPMPLIVRQGRNVSALVCEPSLPLGMGGSLVELAVDRLSPGDRLLFFSDGVVDARSSEGEPFGDARLADVLQKQCLAEVGPAETMRRLLHSVLEHRGSQLGDDATMVMVEFREG